MAKQNLQQSISASLAYLTLASMKTSSSSRVKYWIIAAAVAGAAMLFLLVGRLLGWWAFFTVQSISQMPDVPPGRLFMAGNLKSPAAGRLILFKYFDGLQQQQSIFCFRCVAVAGDTVQLRAGRCYVNGRPADNSANIWLSYELKSERPLELLELYSDRMEEPFADGNRTVPLSPAEAASLQQRLSMADTLKLLDFPLQPEMAWLARIDSSASINQCRPFIVPAQHFFVLGANRHNAFDSRFTGPIHQDSVVGVVYFR